MKHAKRQYAALSSLVFGMKELLGPTVCAENGGVQIFDVVFFFFLNLLVSFQNGLISALLG